MPTECSHPPLGPPPGPSFTSQLGGTKCPLCGAEGSMLCELDELHLFGADCEAGSRVCRGCERAMELRRGMDNVNIDERPDNLLRGLGLTGVGMRNEVEDDKVENADSEEGRGGRTIAIGISITPKSSSASPPSICSQSLPNQHIRSWTSSPSSTINASSSSRVSQPIPPPRETSAETSRSDNERLPNPLLDVCRARMPSGGRGALHAGAIFRGTQTSGRSAYEVEVQLMDVNFAESSVSGYLSISHLTDAHPHLTTFFTGEIIGPHYGFITGARFGATEHDDMRHWGRFEQFRRPSTRGDMLRPELLFRDPLPDRTRGEREGKERDFVFLRIKERFLVPDHKVKDISGASFAGFYYAMVDLSPTSRVVPDTPLSPTPNSPRRLSMSPPPLGTRRSSDGSQRRIPLSEYRNSQAKLAKVHQAKELPPTEATIRGYYFHSLNQEPFQELFLAHVPSRSDGAFELR